VDRIQRSGLISLLLLLGVGAAGILVGPRKVQPDEATPDEVVLQPGELPSVELLAPAQRRLFVDSARFAAEPVNHPLNGGGGRSINDSTSWTPESAVASKPTVNLPDPAMASLKNLTGGTARSLDLGPELVDTPHHTEVERTGRVIRVREYETLGEIAARELGSSTRWTEIANLNGIRDPKSIRVGQELMIPSAEELQTNKKGAEQNSNVSLPDSNGWRTYIVQSGDVAGKISQKVYGTAKLWEGILEANDISDPRELRVGQKLRIPPKP